MLLSLILACAAADLPPVSIDVLEGRVDVANGAGVERRDGGAPELLRDGPGYLEAGARARVRMRWSSHASVEFSGPATFEWRESQGPSGGLYLDVRRLDRADIEVRRGPLRFALPGGWIVHLARGAAYLHRRPDGGYDIEHVAGAPLLLAFEPALGQLRPPRTVLPGATVRLPAESESSATTASAPAEPERSPWSGASWPWPMAESPAHDPRLAAWGPRWRSRR